jgi:hypothetical protein
MSALERIGASSAWEAEALPLDDTRFIALSVNSTVKTMDWG